MRKFSGILAVGILAATASTSFGQLVTWKGYNWLDASMSGTTITLPTGVNGNMEWDGNGTGNTLAANELFTDVLPGVDNTANAAAWRITFSFIDFQRQEDSLWSAIELFGQDILFAGNARFVGGATTVLDPINDLRFRLPSDRTTQINGFGRPMASGSAPQPTGGNSGTGFYFEVKDNFATNARSGGTLSSPLGYVSTGGASMATIDAAGVVSAPKLARIAGIEHEISFDKRADGSLHVIFDDNTVYVYDLGTGINGWVSDDPNFPNWAPNRISLMTRSLGDNTVTWTGFEVLNINQVPEPASLGLLGLGSMLVLARRRKA